MAVFNTPPEYLREAIASILGQTYSEFEFIILDDGSRNVQEIEHVLKGFRDKRIAFLRNEHNRGIAASYNQLIAESQGEYLAIMNHDDVALPGRLERQLTFMEAHPDVGICGTGFKRFGRLLKRRAIIYPEGDAEIRGLMLFKCPIHHPSAMIRKSVLLENAIRYDQQYLSVNDRKLYFDLAVQTKLHNLPDLLMKYRLHRGMATRQIAHVLKQEQQAFRDCYFRKLEVVFSSDELHVIDEYLTCGKTPIYNIIVLKQIEAILLRLIEANKRVRFAGENGFNKILKRYFLKRCLTAAVYGRLSSRELIKYSKLSISKSEKPLFLWFLNRVIKPNDLFTELK
jgi:glycosyltransferase involved in cell wall biosynthesis